jgi:small subunit ribosomal protein S9
MAEKTAKPGVYVEAVGRRKTAIARVRITPSTKTSMVVNEKSFEDYFPVKEQRVVPQETLKEAQVTQPFSISVLVRGGGLSAQAGAIRHGIARALVKYNQELRKVVKAAGLLTRDPRMKERRKFGLRKARRAPQWSKR